MPCITSLPGTRKSQGKKVQSCKDCKRFNKKVKFCTDCKRLRWKLSKVGQFRVGRQKKMELLDISNHILTNKIKNFNKQIHKLVKENARLQDELKHLTTVLFGNYPENTGWIHKLLESAQRKSRRLGVEYTIKEVIAEKTRPVLKIDDYLKEIIRLENKDNSCVHCDRIRQKLSEYNEVLRYLKQNMVLQSYQKIVNDSNVKECEQIVKKLVNERAMLERTLKEQIACSRGGTEAREALFLEYKNRAMIQEQEEAKLLVDLEPEEAAQPVVNVNTDNLHPKRKVSCIKNSVPSHSANQSIKNVDLNLAKNSFRFPHQQFPGRFLKHSQNKFSMRQFQFPKTESETHRYQEEDMPSTSSNTAADKKLKVSETNSQDQPSAPKRKSLPISSVGQASASVRSRTPVPKTHTPVPKASKDMKNEKQ